MKFLKHFFGFKEENIAFQFEKAALKECPLVTEYIDEETEELYWLIESKEMQEEPFLEEEERFLEAEGWVAYLERIIQMDKQSLALNELVRGEYQILEDEAKNPYKELINFTLLYFSNCVNKNPLSAERLLILYFPYLRYYIKREITKLTNYQTIPNSLKVEGTFSEKRAMKELIEFIKWYFTKHCSNKIIREHQLKKHFKYMHKKISDLIKKEPLYVVR